MSRGPALPAAQWVGQAQLIQGVWKRSPRLATDSAPALLRDIPNRLAVVNAHYPGRPLAVADVATSGS